MMLVSPSVRSMINATCIDNTINHQKPFPVFSKSLVALLVIVAAYFLLKG